ncbi:MAG TPA: hypothetical protein VG452_01620 [Egibacteraceae bacterium]|nr:hypothetical protein [Actinomycetota bacterium]HWB70888.1 hypothetical protein [Egibacteraceae bacterium]
MAEGAYGKYSIAQTYALVFGIAYLGVALLELFFPASDPLQVGDTVLLARGTLHNVIHWTVGIAVLGSFAAGPTAARAVARAVGVVFVAVTLLNVFASNFYAELVGLGEGAGTPLVYTLVHAVTAAAALYGGFATRSYPHTAAASAR